MTGYFVALVIGLVSTVVSRFAFWGDLRRAQRLRAEPRIGLVAPALFVFTFSVALVLVGLLGMLHEARAGQRPPVPLDLIWIVLVIGVMAMVVSRQRHRSRRRGARQQRSEKANDD